jgi:hypothetical protein
MSLPQHADKRPKFDRDSDETIHMVWQHYRNYTDADDDEEVYDELQEIIDILNDQCPTSGILTTNNNNDATKVVVRNRRDLLPVLISVASTVLAERYIGEWLSLDSSHQQADEGGKEEDLKQLHKQQHMANIQTHLVRALQSFPQNAQALSIAVNFLRMMVNNHNTGNPNGTNNSISAQDLAEMYLHAADCANCIRGQAIELLRNNDRISDECKEWIEMLLLNQVAGVELLGNNEQDDEEEENEVDPPEDDDIFDEWSESLVEGTARFMAAMQFSMANCHDDAAKQLEYFDVTHRIHPIIWQWSSFSSLDAVDGGNPQNQHHPQPQQDSPPTKVFTPVAFRHSDGILPEPLYRRLCETFAPKSPFWTESSYANRGYYSFFTDLPPRDENGEGFVASNLIEDVVCNHLLPLAMEQLNETKSTSTKIVGFEFWLHTRPMASNLGHNLHFDTDEVLLSQEGLVTHPIVSSILYLTGGSKSQPQGGSGGGVGGATVIFDQSPDSDRVADFAWLSPPVDNSFVVFPGNLLHGVLPCRGSKSILQIESSHEYNKNSKITVENLIHRLQNIWINDNDTLDSSTPHRLTLLVGFWTRGVPDRMKNRKLYGPCGPLPEPDTACWVKDIQKGYNVGIICHKKDSCDQVGSFSSPSSSRKVNIDALPLTCISPAWEHLGSWVQIATSTNANRSKLQIPRSLDHRYFVKDPPGCFRESLFEKDENDEEQTEKQVVMSN